MYNRTLTNLTFQRIQANSQDLETGQTGRPTWWQKLLTNIGEVLFSTDQALTEPEDEVTASPQPATYPVSGYAAYCLECYDLNLYEYDF